MTHGKEDAHADGIDTLTLGIISVVSAIALVVIVLALQVLYYRLESDETQAKVVRQQNTELMDVRSQQQAELSGYRWVDKAAGRVAIPIERAMQLVVSQESLARDQADQAAMAAEDKATVRP